MDGPVGYRRTPEGLLCVNDMPAPVAPGDRRRWVKSRKAVIVAGVRSGLLSEVQACERYALTREELVDWMARYDGGRAAMACLRPLGAERQAKADARRAKVRCARARRHKERA